MKLCPRCKTNESPRAKDPKANSFCSSCQKAYAHQHYLDNKAGYRTRADAWKRAHPEEVKRISREYRRGAVGRTYNLRERYGLTPQQFDELVERQDGRCAICGVKPRKLHIDHDHSAKRVRGLLCGSCNRAIGLFHESTEVMLAAVRYLREA